MVLDGALRATTTESLWGRREAVKKEKRSRWEQRTASQSAREAVGEQVLQFDKLRKGRQYSNASSWREWDDQVRVAFSHQNDWRVLASSREILDCCSLPFALLFHSIFSFLSFPKQRAEKRRTNSLPRLYRKVVCVCRYRMPDAMCYRMNLIWIRNVVSLGKWTGKEEEEAGEEKMFNKKPHRLVRLR